MCSKKMSNSRILIVLICSFFLVSCGGGSKLSLKEAEKITLNYHGESFVPPPRGIDNLIQKIQIAKTPLLCKICKTKDRDINHPKPEVRINNLTHMAARSHKKGKTSLAKEYLKKAEELFNKTKASHHLNARFFLRSSIIYKDIGEYSYAVKMAERALQYVKQLRGPGRGIQVVAYGLLGEIHAAAGNAEASAEAADNAENVFSEIDYSRVPGGVLHFYTYWEARTFIARAYSDQANGKLREAEKGYYKILEKLDDVVQEIKGFYVAKTADVMGYKLVENLLAQGRVSEADFQSRKAVKYTLEQFGRDNFITAKALNGLIKVLLARGEIEDAKKLFFVTEKIYKNILIAESSLALANFRKLLVEALITEGDWEGAERELKKIYHALENDKKAQELFFKSNSSWAIVLLNQDKLSEAQKVANNSIRYSKEIYGDKHVKTALSQGVLAMIKLKQGKGKLAREHFKSISPILTDKKTSSEFRHDAGIDSQHMKIIVDTYLDLLSIAFSKGDKKAAEEAFYLVQSIQGKDTQRTVASSAARSSIKNPELIALVRKEQDATQKIEAGYNKLANLLAVDSSKYNSSLSKKLKSEIESLNQARESILDEIRSRFSGYDDLVRPKPVSFSDAKNTLKEDESLILTYSGKKKLYVWTLLSNGRMAYRASNISKLKLKTLVSQLRESLDLQVSSLKDVPEFNVALSNKLYNAILAPSEYLWGGSRHLIIVPDAVLGSLPFSVLVTDKQSNKTSSNLHFSKYRNEAWLAKTHATSYSPSVITLKILRNKKPDIKTNKLFAGFGNPVFGKRKAALGSSSAVIKSRGAIKLTMRGLRKTRKGSLDNKQVTSSNLDMLVALPETEDEVLQVARALKVKEKGNVFLGFSANEKRIKNMMLNNRSVLMFATHALLPGDLDGLVQPAIALSAPTKALGTGKNDGLLTMGEIMGLDLNADWVVLSACNTGAASGKGATAISGLGQAFFYAGARSLLVSHWPVETTSAKEITTGLFEKQTKDTSLTRAIALNETVKELINKKIYKDKSGRELFSYAHPVFWAPFTVVGDGAGLLN